MPTFPSVIAQFIEPLAETFQTYPDIHGYETKPTSQNIAICG